MSAILTEDQRADVARMQDIVMAKVRVEVAAMPVWRGDPDIALDVWVVEQPEGALVGEHGQRGASPLQADVLRLVADRNCVVARRGGEHRKANGQSAT